MADKSNPLLDLLGGLSQGVQEVSAYRQAALGNPAPLQMLQEQQQQQNLLQNLQQMTQSGQFGEFTPKVMSALQMGGPKAAQKVAAQIPVFKSVSDLVKKSNLNPSNKEAVLNAGLIDPSRALDLYRSLAIIEKQQAGRSAIEAQKEARDIRKEERRLQKVESKLPGNILASELEKGTVDVTDIPSVLGVLQARGVKIPGTPGEQQLWVKNLLANPSIKRYIKVEEKPGIVKSMLDFFKRTPQAPAPQQETSVQAPAAPSLSPEQLQRLEELRRKRGQ